MPSTFSCLLWMLTLLLSGCGQSLEGAGHRQGSPVDLWITDLVHHRIIQVAAEGGGWQTSAEGAPIDMPSSALVVGEALFVSNFSTNEILWRPDPDAPFEVFYRDLDALEEPTRVLHHQGLIMVLGNDSENVVALDATGQVVFRLGDGRIKRAHDMAFGPDGLLYIAVDGTDQGWVEIWDLSQQTRVGWRAPPGGPQIGVNAMALAFDEAGALYIADAREGRIVRDDGERVSDWAQAPRPISLAAAEGVLYVLSDGRLPEHRRLERIDLSSGRSLSPLTGSWLAEAGRLRHLQAVRAD